MLDFQLVAETFSDLENTSGRLEMTDILAELFKKTKHAEIDKLVYLMQGILLPPYEGVDVGVGERFAIGAIAASAGYSINEVDKHYKKSGDLGLTAEELLSKKKQTALMVRKMDVTFVYNSFMKIATSAGSGSQELKIKLLTELLNNSTPIEARFIVRFVLGRLRLGVGDPTILDALSVSSVQDKSLREPLERAYNVCSDMGYVAQVFFETPKKIEKFKVSPFKPLMPALAERLSTPEDIIEKIGKCGVERKYDGFRLQCHKKGNNVELYSRKLEKMTHMFPDVVKEIQGLKAKEIIFEGEALAYDNKRKRYFSFQQTMHRRRKYGIEKMKKELPLNIFCFDILYLDGKDMTEKIYSERRSTMKKLFPKGILLLSESLIVDKSDELDNIFHESLDSGLEGIMAKDLSAPYTAGKRKFAWIKLKKSYGKSVDTIDAVVVGYFLGKGARAQFKFGGLLVAVINQDNNKLETIAKIGSGYTEEEMVELQEMLVILKTKEPPRNLDYRIEPDFWVEPKYVVEVAFDELTRSPTHTCGMENEKGLALRFPRLMKIRQEKSIKEATTTDEVVEMFELQRSK
jgi:DNA ligase-1